MRTTVTLDPDVARLRERLMRERGLTFRHAVNHAIRAGLTGQAETAPVQTPTFRMGFEPAIPWDKALRLAAELEDGELVRRLAARK